jgi:hypothetical protein
MEGNENKASSAQDLCERNSPDLGGLNMRELDGLDLQI